MQDNTENKSVYTPEKSLHLGIHLEGEGVYQENFNSRARKQREKLGLTQKKLAELIGVSVTSVQSYESGAMPKGKFIIKLAEALHCTTDYLLLGKVSTDPEGAPAFDMIPMAAARLNAGGGNVVLSEDFEESYAFRKDWVRRISTGKNNIFLMAVEGDSMEPVICNNDTVMIDAGRKIINTGNIYAIGISDTIMIKRLELLPGEQVRIISQNKEYSPYIIGGETLRVIGQVIWYARELVKLD